MATSPKHATVSATVQAWLFGGRLRHWGSARARWLNGGLTLALLLAGVAAWVLAIVQPWTVRAADPGIVPVKGQVTPDRVRQVAADASLRVEAPAAKQPRPIGRNPFRASATASGGPAASGPCGFAGGKTDPLGIAPTARQIADLVKDLRLKATVLGPNGQRWAVINGNTYQEGEDVAGLTLVEIREDRARLRRADVTCVLKMD